jgi:hypothetical protein
MRGQQLVLSALAQARAERVDKAVATVEDVLVGGGVLGDGTPRRCRR